MLFKYKLPNFFKRNLLIILLLFLALMLRFYRISNQSIWFDEAISITFAEFSPTDIIKAVILDTQAPFYYLLLHFWLILGKSEFIVRALSAIFGIAYVYLVYLIGCKIFDKRVGLIATFLVAISPFNIYYAQEVRVYALLTSLVLLCIYATTRLLERYNIKDQIIIIVTIVIGIYTHYYFLFVALGINIYVLLERNKSRITLIRDGDDKFIGKWVLSQLVVFLLLIPWIPVIYKQYFNPRVGMRTPNPLNLLGIKNVINSLIKILNVTHLGHSNVANEYNILNIISFFITIIFVLGIIAAVKERRKINFLITFYFLPLILASILSFHNNWLGPRYFIILAPVYYIFVAQGVSILYNKKILFSLILLLITSLFFISLIDYYYKFQKGENWREVAQIINYSVRNVDSIILTEPVNIYPFTYYYKGDAQIYIVKPYVYRSSIKTIFNRYKQNWVIYVNTMPTKHALEIMEYIKKNYRELSSISIKGVDIYIFAESS